MEESIEAAQSLALEEAILVAVLGAVIALIGRWILEFIQRRLDEKLNIYVKEVAQVSPEYDPDHELTILIENTSPVPVLVRSVRLEKPPGIQTMTFVSLVGEHFVVDRVALNAVIPPFSVEEVRIDIQTPRSIRKQMSAHTIEGHIQYNRRGKRRTQTFDLPYEEVNSRYEQDDLMP